jgi:hypothetical protein
MKRVLACSALVVFFVIVGTSCCADRLGRQAAQAPAVPASSAPASGTVDLTPRTLARIPVGTTIGKTAPRGWTHLILLVIPTLTDEDLRDAPKMATHYAQMFKLTIVANVGRRQDGDKPTYFLKKVARGFATTIDGTETIVNGQNTLNADLGLFGRRILDENEKVLDNDVVQVVRTDTMLIFDAKCVMRRGDDHVNMIMRHAILVDPATGKLYTLVWLLTEDYQVAEKTMQLLPEGMHEKRLLSVKRDKFNALGIPTRDAFGLRQVPQGTPIPYTPALEKAATVAKFEAARVPDIEETLRAAASKAAGR